MASESGSASGSTPLLPEEYDSLIERLRESANAHIPRNATVLVVSRGDDELLRVGPRRALHFPQDEFGRYPGYHPEDSRAAIELLESMRVRGGEYLLLPSTSFWWLDYYEGFRDHLARRYPPAVESDDCMIFELSPTGVEMTIPDADSDEVPSATPSPQVAGLDELLRALLPPDARVASDMASAGEAQFLVIPAGDHTEHPPDGWRLVTHQRHLCTIYERPGTAEEPAPVTGGSPAANGGPPARIGLLARLRRLFRGG
jgi:hypothetical protein